MTEDKRDPNTEEPARPTAQAPATAPDSGYHGTPAPDQAAGPTQSTDQPPATASQPPVADRPPVAPASPTPPTAPTPPSGDQPGAARTGAHHGDQPAAAASTGASAHHGDWPVAASPTGASAQHGDQPAEPASSSAAAGSTQPAAGSMPSTGQTPAAAFAGSGGETPPRGFPAQAPGERVLFGSAFTQGGLGTPPQSGAYPSMAPPTPPVGPSQPPHIPEQRKGRGGLVAGVTVLALLVGGGAGAVGGYLVAENNQENAPVANALDQPRPAERTSTAPAGSVTAVADKVLPSVVQLQVRGRSAAGEGSGFVISSDGLIVTNNHVVEAAAEGGQIVAVFHDGSTASAQIVGRDPTSDVAVVRADKTGLQVVELGRSDDLRVGEGVVAFGSPFELSGTVTSGIVSSLHRPTRAGGEDGSQATVMDAIQTDAAINPGNSGGPLVNTQGQVIGINSAIYNPSQGGSIGIGFAIPIDQARRTADEIVKTGKATQTILGVTVRDNEEGGALVVDVTPDGPGAKAGLKQGDVVTKLDERKIDTSDALVAAVRSHKPGDKVRLELSNGSRTVETTLAGQPVETE